MWATITLQERTGTSSPWRWSADVIFRSRDGVDALDTLTFRVTVGYDVTARTSVWAGYVNSQTFPVAGGSVLEHRFFGQHLWSGRSRGGGLSFRTRFEQRDVENNSGPAWRVRHQIRYSHPFREGSRLYWVGADEILIHTNATTRYDRGFDQNRMSVGIGHPIGSSARVEAGYLNQFSHSVIGPNRLNHIVSVVINAGF